MKNCHLSHSENIDRLIRLREVLTIVPVAKSTWWAWCAQGKAPKPIKLSEKTTCWRLSDIIAFVDQVAGQGVK